MVTSSSSPGRGLSNNPDGLGGQVEPQLQRGRGLRGQWQTASRHVYILGIKEELMIILSERLLNEGWILTEGQGETWQMSSRRTQVLPVQGSGDTDMSTPASGGGVGETMVDVK